MFAGTFMHSGHHKMYFTYSTIVLFSMNANSSIPLAFYYLRTPETFVCDLNDGAFIDSRTYEAVDSSIFRECLKISMTLPASYYQFTIKMEGLINWSYKSHLFLGCSRSRATGHYTTTLLFYVLQLNVVKVNKSEYSVKPHLVPFSTQK